jgi:hypothetical protein
LTRRNIPFAFVTGYGRQALPESFGQSPMLTKPFTQEQLLQTAARLVRTVPRGLRLHKDREPHLTGGASSAGSQSLGYTIVRFWQILLQK